MGNQSMKERAQGYADSEQRNRERGTSRSDVNAPIEQFPQPTYGIVGRDVVRARFATNTPGFSQTIICSEIREGWTAPVSVSDVRLFDTLEHALFIRDQETGGGVIGGGSQYEQSRAVR